MHELAICQALIAQVERVAVERGADTVTRIAVSIGPLSGVEADLLERAFTIARAGTMASGAKLELELLAIRVRCSSCGAESDATSNRLICAACGDWKTKLVAGDELMLRQVEMETTETRQDHV